MPIALQMRLERLDRQYRQKMETLEQKVHAEQERLEQQRISSETRIQQLEGEKERLEFERAYAVKELQGNAAKQKRAGSTTSSGLFGRPVTESLASSDVGDTVSLTEPHWHPVLAVQQENIHAAALVRGKRFGFLVWRLLRRAQGETHNNVFCKLDKETLRLLVHAAMNAQTEHLIQHFSENPTPEWQRLEERCSVNRRVADEDIDAFAPAF